MIITITLTSTQDQCAPTLFPTNRQAIAIHKTDAGSSWLLDFVLSYLSDLEIHVSERLSFAIIGCRSATPNLQGLLQYRRMVSTWWTLTCDRREE